MMQGVPDNIVNAAKQAFKVLCCIFGVVALMTALVAFNWGLIKASDATTIDPSVARQKRIEDKVDLVIIKLDQLSESK